MRVVCKSGVIQTQALLPMGIVEGKADRQQTFVVYPQFFRSKLAAVFRNDRFQHRTAAFINGGSFHGNPFRLQIVFQKLPKK